MTTFCISANNPPNITGPATFLVRQGSTFTFSITVTDTNLASFTIVGGVTAGSVLTVDGGDASLYTFTWTPVDIVASPIVFRATDDLGASSDYQPRLEFCRCRDEGECTLNGVPDRSANPLDLNCACTTGKYRYHLTTRRR